MNKRALTRSAVALSMAFASAASAVNIVTNGDFETFSPCPTGLSQMPCPPWTSPTLASPDYHNACNGNPADANVPVNAWGAQAANSGVGYCHMRIYGNVPPQTTTDYREYIEAPLDCPMVAGATYNVSFWVSLTDAASGYATSDIGAYFSVGPVGPVGTAVNLPFTPQVVNTSGFLSNKIGWTQVSGVYIAAGGEDHVVIGNFKDDASSNATFVGGGCCPVATYYIDDVVVDGPCGFTDPCGNDCLVGATLEQEPCGIFSNNGCDTGALQSEPIQCNETICGTFFNLPPTRDLDSYEFVLFVPTTVTWTVYADVPVDASITDTNCGSQTTFAVGSGNCPNTTIAVCLPPGKYLANVAPAINAFVGCGGSDSQYVANLACDPCFQDPCPEPCPPGAVIEQEPCGGATNNGCNGPLPPQFQGIKCGDTICGTFWLDLNVRDTDWYGFVLSAPTIVKWKVWADVPVDIAIYNTNCGNLVQFASGVGNCPAMATTACLPPGQYFAYVAPSFGGPNVLCGSPESKYVAQLMCMPCDNVTKGCCNENGPGFMDPSCEAMVCAVMPSCCEFDCDPLCEAFAADLCDCCETCVRPPPNLVSWWPLDEAPGPNVAIDVASAHNGTLTNGVIAGLGGMVNASAALDGVDDVVVVPSHTDFDVMCGPFTVDAWIRPAPGAQANGVIFQKHGGNPPTGWVFGLDSSSSPPGALYLIMETTFVRCAPNSQPIAVVPNAWNHVAVTASAAVAGSRTITFYINGAVAGVVPGVVCDCFPPINVNELIGNGDFFGPFNGKIDELQFFRRELGANEINNLWAAGSKGKCKHRCHVDWDKEFCFNQTAMTVVVTVCNDSTTPGLFNLSFNGSTPFTGCNGPLLAPGNFSVIGPNPVPIGPNTCVSVQVQITRPPGLEPGEVSCYEICVEEVETKQRSHCSGSVVRNNKWCWVKPDPFCCIEAVLPGTPVLIVFEVKNTSDRPRPISEIFKTNVMPSDMGPDPLAVSLNGLPPGTRYIGNLMLGPGESTEVEIEATFLKHVPLRSFDVVVEADFDDDGTYEPIASAGLASAPGDEFNPCPADLNNDGVVNGADLGLLLANWNGSGDTDLNQDGTTDGADLGLLLASWGDC